MAKNFINIDNLKIVWDEINKRFVRYSTIADQLSLLVPNTLTCNNKFNIPLVPHWTGEITEDNYNYFIEFVNSDNTHHYVKDYNNCLRQVISKYFYDNESGKFLGVLLSTNGVNEGDEKDVRVWYIRTYKDGEIYKLEWEEYIGEILSGNFVDFTEYTIAMNNLNESIKKLNTRMSELEGNVVPDDDYEEDSTDYYEY